MKCYWTFEIFLIVHVTLYFGYVSMGLEFLFKCDVESRQGRRTQVTNCNKDTSLVTLFILLQFHNANHEVQVLLTNLSHSYFLKGFDLCHFLTKDYDITT